MEQPALSTIGKTARASGRCTGRPRLCSGGSGLSRAARLIKQNERSGVVDRERETININICTRLMTRPADRKTGVAEHFLARAGSFYGAAIKRRFCVDQNLNLVLGPRWGPGPGSNMDHTFVLEIDR